MPNLKSLQLQQLTCMKSSILEVVYRISKVPFRPVLNVDAAANLVLSCDIFYPSKWECLNTVQVRGVHVGQAWLDQVSTAGHQPLHCPSRFRVNSVHWTLKEDEGNQHHKLGRIRHFWFTLLLDKIGPDHAFDTGFDWSKSPNFIRLDWVQLWIFHSLWYWIRLGQDQYLWYQIRQFLFTWY